MPRSVRPILITYATPLVDVKLAMVTAATVSTSAKGSFNQTATVPSFISAKTESDVSFYVRPGLALSSFKVYIASRSLFNSPDWLTTFVDFAATYNAINAQYLLWIGTPGLWDLSLSLSRHDGKQNHVAETAHFKAFSNFF